MKKSDILKFIASILSYKTDNKYIIDYCGKFITEWDFFIKIASKHLVLPTVYCRLKTRGLLHILPVDLELYLKEITSLNNLRNKSLLLQAEQINTLFKSHNIDYVFLKGMALLKGNYYNNIAERMIGDIDILVHSNDIYKANQILQEAGYYSINDNNNETLFNHRHLPRLVSDKYIGAIELHDKLLSSNFLLNLEETAFLKYKIMVNNIPIPINRSLLEHNIFNFQLNDNAFIYGTFSLRNAYDTIVILKKDSLVLNLNNMFQKSIYRNYFYLLSTFFETPMLKKNKSISFVITCFFIVIMNHPKLNQVYKFFVNSIKYFFILLSRFKVFLFKKKYREQVLLHRTQITTHVYNFFSNL
ncbi:nucleotidyltransferase family protein [Thalassobellus citreus]|uniref:nucleotidyltransferase family protein n=1 Tax=Thalassobellus citreus TaxID=3367752 RepID=UPI00378DC9ED